MLKYILLAVFAVILGLFTGYTVKADGPNPNAHYHLGQSQAFGGIVCKELDPALEIFAAFKAEGFDAMKAVAQTYIKFDMCRGIYGKTGFFKAVLDEGTMEARDSAGQMQKYRTVLFSIAPSQASPIEDYLVTTEIFYEAPVSD